MDFQEAKQNSDPITQGILTVYRDFVCSIKPGINVTFREGATFADSDYKVYINGKFHHFIEVKERQNEIYKYSRTKFPLRKHATAEHYFVSQGIKTYFVARFSGGVFATLRLWEEPDSVEEMVARHDRGNDTDLYAMYDVKRFRIIKNETDRENREDQYTSQQEAKTTVPQQEYIAM